MLAIGYSPFWCSPPTPPPLQAPFFAYGGPPTQMMLLEMLAMMIELRYGVAEFPPDYPPWANGNACYCREAPPCAPPPFPSRACPPPCPPVRMSPTSVANSPQIPATPATPPCPPPPCPPPSMSPTSVANSPQNPATPATPPTPTSGPDWVQTAQTNCGAPLPFTNSKGQTEAVSIQTRDNKTYIQTEHGEFQVEFKGDFTPEQQSQAIARAVDYYTQVPPQFRGEVKKLKFHTEERDGGACVRWDEDDDQINFYGGLQGVEPQGFFREFGRFIGKNLHKEGKLEKLHLKSGEPAPPGWGTAMDADGNYLNEKRKDAGDDFAESWGFYMFCGMCGDQTQQQARQSYANRWALIDGINAGA